MMRRARRSGAERVKVRIPLLVGARSGSRKCLPVLFIDILAVDFQRIRELRY